MTVGVEFRLLGEVAMYVDNQLIDLGPARRRCVLAVLVVEANYAVRVEQIVDRVWGEHPPPRATDTLRSYLSRLRTALAAADHCRIRRHNGGYVLELRQADVDLQTFRQLVAQARHSDDEQAVELYDRALYLWHGEALADLDGSWAASMRRTLQEELLAATLDYHDVRLRRGDHVALLPPIEELALRHPLDERLAGQILVARYRCGRQADALRHYEQLRNRLVDELGTDPSPSLQKLYQQLLNADTSVEPPPPAIVAGQVPRPSGHLPPRPVAFTGRSREVSALDEAFADRSGLDRTATIAAVVGGAGTGKTWLVKRWANDNADGFPDGQIYIDLCGFHPTAAPMRPDVVARTILRSVGVDPASIPAAADALVPFYRSTIGDKRMLIVLDNVRDTAQVESLLPGRSRCCVLVTSRNHLVGLAAGYGGTLVVVDAIGPVEAARLLARRLGADRMAAEPAAVGRLVERCAGLPVALGIVAARAALHPQWSLHELASEVPQASRPLDAFDAGEPGMDLRQVISWSYRTLEPAPAYVFRMIGGHPGLEFSLHALASLVDASPPTLRGITAELTRIHLVTEPAPGRYAIHRLVHQFAAELAASEETSPLRRTATRRVVDHYVHAAHAAALIVDPIGRPITLPEPEVGTVGVHLTGLGEAIAWFTTELTTLTAVVRRATVDGLHAQAWRLAWCLEQFFRYQERWTDIIDTHRAVLRSEPLQSDRVGSAFLHRGLAHALSRLARYQEADEHLGQAVALLG